MARTTLNICEDKHDEIAFVGDDECPLCAEAQRNRDLEEANEDLTKQVGALEDEVSSLESKIDELNETKTQGQ